ncbi:MAG TPA: hypothetical protein PLB41_05245, partial [Rubrivivax sp.]|nr:hypothetical protein [Rubrivivax sp.]
MADSSAAGPALASRNTMSPTKRLKSSFSTRSTGGPAAVQSFLRQAPPDMPAQQRLGAVVGDLVHARIVAWPLVVAESAAGGRSRPLHEAKPRVSRP